MTRWLTVPPALLAAALVLGGCTEPPYSNVDNVQLKRLMDEGVALYDIRRPEEWRQTGVVAGSRKLTYSESGGKPHPEFLRRFTAEVHKDEPVILICRSGNRTDRLARHLVEQLGYTQVYNVRHGIIRWVGDDQPVIRN
jgi:rhodanese-related sulfurtransferase